MTVRGFIALFLFGIQQSTAAAEPVLHHSQVFLNSIYAETRLSAPRLELAASKTFIAHPSRLQKWGIIGSDAAAAYNGLTNTLVLQPEMTVFDRDFGRRRVASLQEIQLHISGSARVNAGVIFHELSHAEFDLYVEEEAGSHDYELMNAIRAELPAIIVANSLSPLGAYALSSEIFAYYREELLLMLLMDVAEIKLSSGLDPDTHSCRPLRTELNGVRDLMPNDAPYSTRVDLETVWVNGNAVKLNIDKNAGRRLNRALAKHAEATMLFPKSRTEMLNVMRTNKVIQNAMASCREARLLREL